MLITIKEEVCLPLFFAHTNNICIFAIQTKKQIGIMTKFEKELVDMVVENTQLSISDVLNSKYLLRLKKCYPLDEAYDRFIYMANTGLFYFLEYIYGNK